MVMSSARLGWQSSSRVSRAVLADIQRGESGPSEVDLQQLCRERMERKVALLIEVWTVAPASVPGDTGTRYLSQSCGLHLMMEELDLVVNGQNLAPPAGPSACSECCGTWDSCWQSPLGLFVHGFVLWLNRGGFWGAWDIAPEDEFSPGPLEPLDLSPTSSDLSTTDTVAFPGQGGSKGEALHLPISQVSTSVDVH